MLLWTLVAIEAALFAVLTFRRRVPLFRVWLILAALGAFSVLKQSPFEQQFWSDWIFGERLVIAARVLIVAEAFWLASVGLTMRGRASLASAGIVAAGAAVIAAWTTRQDGLTGFIQFRLYSHVALFMFCLTVLLIFWRANRVPQSFALRHGLLVTWIMACHAVVAFIDRYIVTDWVWTLTFRVRLVALCFGLAWGIWFNLPSRRIRATPFPAALSGEADS